jgi:hypothetical protein
VQDSKVIDDLVRQKLRKFANFTKMSKYMANKRLKTYRERIENERRLNEESEKPKTTSTERVKRWRQRRKEEAVAHKWVSVDDGAVPSTSTGITHSQLMQMDDSSTEDEDSSQQSTARGNMGPP